MPSVGRTAVMTMCLSSLVVAAGINLVCVSVPALTFIHNGETRKTHVQLKA